jgi:hypothetical protein
MLGTVQDRCLSMTGFEIAAKMIVVVLPLHFASMLTRVVFDNIVALTPT